MPAVYLFGQRTLLGGDDLQVPSGVTIVARIIQFTLLAIPLLVLMYRQALALDDNNDSTIFGSFSKFIWSDPTRSDDNSSSNLLCHNAHYYPLWMTCYIVSTTIFCVVSWILEYRIYYWSCQGTPTLRQPRTAKIQHLLEYKLGTLAFTELLLIVTFVVAFVGYAKAYHQCPAYDVDGDDNGGGRWVGGKLWWSLAVILFLSQCSETFVALIFRWGLMKSSKNDNDLMGDENYDGYDDDGVGNTSAVRSRSRGQRFQERHELTEELWADRCQSLFYCISVSTCFLFGGHDIVANATQQQQHRSRSRRAGGHQSSDVDARPDLVIQSAASTATTSHAACDIYIHLAQALADYLETRGTLDVVPTDLVTGLLVLQRLQRQRMLQARRDVINSQSNSTANLAGGGSAAINLTRESTPVPYDMTSSRNIGKPPSEGYGETNVALTGNDLLNLDDPSSSTGLRSRVSSSNDLTRRTVSPNPISPVGQDTNGSSSGSAGSATGVIQRRTTPKSTKRGSKPLTIETSSETARLVASSPLSNLNALMTKNSTRAILPEPPVSIHMSFSNGYGDDNGTLRPQSASQFLQPIYRRCHSTDKNQGYFHSNNESLLPVATMPTTNRWFSKPYYKPQTRQVLNPNDPVDVARLQEGARMAKYALAIYTWKLYLYTKPFSGLPKLCCRSCSTCCLLRSSDPTNGSSLVGRSSIVRQGNRRRGSSREDVLLDVASGDSTSRDRRHDGVDHRTYGDNICQWHKHALMLVAGLHDSDLMYAQFQNRFAMVPYCIMVDHQNAHVILSIRGSLSLEDVVTDTLIKPAPLDDVGERYGFDANDQYCHAGVRSCFENVMDDLERHGILEQLLERDFPDYELRITGHSLGAGVAVLISYALRSKYPTLKVFGFSPPGCTMTWELATQCQAWTTSFVLDNEIVPRLSVLALEDLRDEVLDLIGRVKVPKYQIFQMSLKAPKNIGCCYGPMDGDDLEELTESIHEILDDVPHDTLYQRQLTEFLQVQDERKEARGRLNSRQLRLYPTGRMIHLMKTGEEGGCTHLMNKALTCCMSNSGFYYAPVYIGNDDLDEIVVSPTMGTDHFIDRMFDELRKLSDQYVDQSGGIGSTSTASDHHEMV